MPLNDGWDYARRANYQRALNRLIDPEVDRAAATLWLLEAGWNPWTDGEIIAGCVVVPQEWADGNR